MPRAKGPVWLVPVVGLLALFAPARAQAACCGFEMGSCTARSHTLPQCQAGTAIVDGDVDDLFECWTAGFIAVSPLDPISYLVALAAGEAYCDGQGDRTCTANLTDAQCADSDGDGLLDDWETSGVDVDSDGTVDVDLPAMGADPNHKDLFLELDVMTGEAPSRSEVQRMVQAFAAAPTNVGGIANPDGTPGIHLWVDTGNLADNAAAEDGALAGSCNDGVDNGGDGATDGADADCLVGVNLGGGNNLVASDICDLDPTFYAAKAANFSAARAQIFRYAISARGCDEDADGSIDSGGWGEIGGNDFVEFNHDGGTIMHELGHTLGLRHGGDVNANCKPNYVSVMNYDQQFGIRQAGGTSILDYSPPRFVGGRGVAELPTLIENALDENLILDGTDATNRFVFVNANGAKVQAQLNGNADFSADGSDPPFESSLSVNIDTSSLAGNPAACTNTSMTSTLTGHHDWNVASLPFTQFGDSADGGVNVSPTPDPTLQDLTELEVDLNTTDLSVTKTATPDPAVAGSHLEYQLLVVNRGPNPASEIVLSDALPAGTSFFSADAGCTASSPLVLACELPELLAGQSLVVGVDVLVDPALVYDAGGPTSIANQCSVENLRGPDVSYGDNGFTLETDVVAVADLAVDSFVVEEAPAKALAGEPIEIVFAKELTNAGPSSPMDGRTEASASAPAGSFAAPQTPTSVELALAIGSPRLGSEGYDVVCGAPGELTFGFTTSVHPLSPFDTDPNPENDSASGEHTLDCVVPVAVNVNPHRADNSVNLNGAIEVEILTTLAGEYGLPLPFDAASIVPNSVHFGLRNATWEGSGGATPHQGWFRITRSYELDDVTRDSDNDMLLSFQGPDTGLTGAAIEACVFGEFVGSGGTHYHFFGCDQIRILGTH